MFYQGQNCLIRQATVFGILVVASRSIEYGYISSCALKDTCHECLQAPDCTWCEQPDYDGSRCLANYLIDRCAENYRVHHNVTEDETDYEDYEFTEHTNYSGKYCECDNFSCERSDGKLCSGPDHGTCECGQCNCLPEWEGPGCDCFKSKEPCTPPYGGEICSGNGECHCGQCKCKFTVDGRYSGKYCEKCPTCSGRCLELKDCVQCQMYRTGPLKDEKECATQCSSFTPVGVDKVEIDEEEDEWLCTFYDEDDCKFLFKYFEVGDKLVVHAQQERECPSKVSTLSTVVGVIAAIVLVSLVILLLRKLLTKIRH